MTGHNVAGPIAAGPIAARLSLAGRERMARR